MICDSEHRSASEGMN